MPSTWKESEASSSIASGVPNRYFASNFIHEALGEAVSSLYWGGGAGNSSFT